MEYLMPTPIDGKTRAILAKKHQLEGNLSHKK